MTEITQLISGQALRAAWIESRKRPHENRKHVVEGDCKSSLIDHSISEQSSAFAAFPHRPSYFVGREEELRTLEAALEDRAHTSVVSISGMGGIGKTTLAIEAAWRAAKLFPDGAAAMDLQGFSSEKAPGLSEVINSLSSQLKLNIGSSGSIEQRLAKYRHATFGRRILLLMDNALSEDQVLPIIADPPACLIVTSRRSIVVDDKQKTLNVGLLQDSDARKLINRIAGSCRCISPEEIDELIADCMGVPLALSAASMFLRKSSHRNVSDYLDILRFRATTTSDPVLTVIGYSVDVIRREASEVIQSFGKLSVFSGSFEDQAAASIWGIPIWRARSILDHLAMEALVTIEHDRFRLHDRVREVARREIDSNTFAATEARHAEYFIETLCARVSRIELNGNDSDIHPDDKHNIFRAMSWMVYQSSEETVWQELADKILPRAFISDVRMGLTPYLLSRMNGEMAINAAKRRDDKHALALVGVEFAYCQLYSGWQWNYAYRTMKQVVEFARSVDAAEAEMRAYHYLASHPFWESAQNEVQTECVNEFGKKYCMIRCAMIAKKLGKAGWRAYAVAELGTISFSAGHLWRAQFLYTRALRILPDGVYEKTRGAALANLGIIALSLMNHEEGLCHLKLAQGAFRRGECHYDEARVLWTMAGALDSSGQQEEAITSAKRALDVLEQLGGQAHNAGVIREWLEEREHIVAAGG